MPRALLSCYDKTGLVPFARGLSERGWTLLSTGGTAAALREAGLSVTEVSEITGHPEMMQGRVKTLHPAVHAGLLARRHHPDDVQALQEQGYGPISLVTVNLYPFRETVAREGVTVAEAAEQIDIGGPAMLRAAAKNHGDVWAVVDPADYPRVLDALDGHGEGDGLRREFAAKVFTATAAYDAAIADYLSGRAGTPPSDWAADGNLPPQITLDLHKVQDLRYGENPDQPAALYADGNTASGLPGVRQLHGAELSFINLLDTQGGLFAVSLWQPGEAAACAIIKHATPSGIAVAGTVEEAYRRALSTDPTSAFGSVVAFNREVTEEVAALMRPHVIHVVVAPDFAPGALELLRQKKNIRLLALPAATIGARTLDFKRVRGGFLVQQEMQIGFSEEDWRVITERQPSTEEWNDLRFAWRAVAAVKSNAILLARDGQAIGIGAGQMSRVDASRIAVMKARENGFDLAGAALASDAFFPFRDGVDAAAEAGIRAVIQPGGSIRDEEVITAANEHGIAMVLTGRRLFRH